MSERRQVEPEPAAQAGREQILETFEHTAQVLRSIAATARAMGDLSRAARMEHLADEAEQHLTRTRIAGHPSDERQAQQRQAGTRVLLVDDHELAREALRSVLTPEQGFLVVGEASDGQMAVRLGRRLRPDLVLMDVRMPGMDGLAATRAVLAELPETRIVMLTSHEQRALVLDALRAGAAGYLLKGASKQEVLETIRAAVAGERRVQGSLAADLLDQEARGPSPTPSTPLSQREVEVIRLLAAGQSNAQIAGSLQISLNTVKTHVQHMLRKLDVPDRASAVARAAALGLLADGGSVHD